VQGLEPCTHFKMCRLLFSPIDKAVTDLATGRRVIFGDPTSTDPGVQISRIGKPTSLYQGLQVLVPAANG